MTSAAAHNANESPPPPPKEGFVGSQALSAEEQKSVASDLLGQPASSFAAVQIVNQLRYQGLWWGAERIWTDELVRLKLSRRQFAPNGGDSIYPPSGPSPSTVEYNQPSPADDPTEDFGAGAKGLFIRVDGLFVVDVPGPDRTTFKECRVSGMLFELADEDWPDPNQPSEQPVDKGKGRATIDDHSTLFEDESALPDVGSISIDGPNRNSTPNGSISSPAFTSQQQKLADLNDQLSHPVRDRYALPPAPTGYKFRPILAPGHEVVISLSLVAGRYYPRLFGHRLVQPWLKKALEDPSGLYSNMPLWAMEGLMPGAYQSMDPVNWKGNRQVMFQDADALARTIFKERYNSWKADQDEDVAMEDLFGPSEGSSISAAG